MLIVWGLQDTWHPVDWARTFQSMVPGSRLEILPEGGNLHPEQPEAVNRVLRKFLPGGA